MAGDIARCRNYARVHELSGDKAFGAWLAATGFTLEEAAKIQPAYCYITVAAACFCMHASPTVAEAVVVEHRRSDDATVRIERIEGSPTALKVGDIVDAHVYSAGAGDYVLLSVAASPDAGTVPELWDAEVRVDDGGRTSTCDVNEFAQTHPVSEDVLLQALTAGDQCENRLVKQNAGWKGSQCDPDADRGCALGHDHRPPLPPVLTTASVLAAILRYRRRRSAHARAGTSGRA
jgi:hypothetical protein